MDQDPNNQPKNQPEAVPSTPVTTTDQPAAPAPTQPGAPVPAPVGENPGQLFGILSIVADFIGLAVVGIVLGVISRNKSKAAGHSTTLGTVGMVLGIVFTVIGALWLLLMIIGAMAGLQASTSSDGAIDLAPPQSIERDY